MIYYDFTCKIILIIPRWTLQKKSKSAEVRLSITLTDLNICNLSARQKGGAKNCLDVTDLKMPLEVYDTIFFYNVSNFEPQTL